MRRSASDFWLSSLAKEVVSALLNIASAQSELGDLQAARATLQEVASKYPASEAGAKAKQRLGIR